MKCGGGVTLVTLATRAQAAAFLKSETTPVVVCAVGSEDTVCVAVSLFLPQIWGSAAVQSGERRGLALSRRDLSIFSLVPARRGSKREWGREPKPAAPHFSTAATGMSTISLTQRRRYQSKFRLSTRSFCKKNVVKNGRSVDACRECRWAAPLIVLVASIAFPLKAIL